MEVTENMLRIPSLAASKVWARWGRPASAFGFADLRSIGLEALMKWCSEHDEPDPQKAWGRAYARVYGAILDWLRSEDYLGRRTRARARKIKAVDGWEGMSHEALSRATGIPVAAVKETLRQMRRTIVNIDDVQISEEKPSGLPLELLENIEEKDRVFLLRVFGEEGPAVIAKELGVTQSRVSQLKLALIRKYRVKLRSLL